MQNKNRGVSTDVSSQGIPQCNGCGRCVAACAFLKEHGSPFAIQARLEESPEAVMDLAFLCSLCGLCTALCPHGADPAAFFLGLRRLSVAQGRLDLSNYAPLLAYEARGVSRRFSWAHLPQGCHTVFFPGCGLSGTRPGKTHELWQYLREHCPSTGIVLDCCTKPSHDLGRQAAFEGAFYELSRWLLAQGVRRVWVACPNCYTVFRRYGRGLEVESVYERMAEDQSLIPAGLEGSYTIHDPCAVRFEKGVHHAVKTLAARSGAQLVTTTRQGRLTACCGEGGSVGAVHPLYPEIWREGIHARVKDARLLTYCSGCASRLGKGRPVHHILDLYFNGTAGISKGATSPLTYLNRLRLKKKIQGRTDASVTRQRHISMAEGEKKRGWKRGALFLVLIAVVVGLHQSGMMAFISPEAVRQWVDGYGGAAPLVFVALYCIAPSLLLPATPLVLAASLLFGPVMGLVYAMVGGTGAATLSFLISRYLARGWVRRKVAGSGMEALDRKVANGGWKAVLLARLVPASPFFLLNYAFGLTGVSLSSYVVATFFGILPATLAVIFLSHSLLMHI